jgi:hypothetical protein
MGWKSISIAQYWRMDANQRMQAFGITGPDSSRKRVLWFNLSETPIYSSWKGKLVVDFPPPDRAWFRWAAKNTFSVSAILEESALNEKMSDWRKIELSWDKLQVLPSEWKSALRQWRGIYFIFDKSMKQGYVGSAYGRENILGRWLNYAASGDGGNKRLRECEPKDLTFSILERVSPDMDTAEVCELEASWKSRLHTREFGLNLN